MSKRRNPDDWFTGLTGASKNTGGPPSNVVFSGHPHGYDTDYGNHGVTIATTPIPKPRTRGSVEPTHMSPVKREPDIIILDDDTPPVSPASQPSFSRHVNRTPPRQTGNRLQVDPSIVILDTPPQPRAKTSNSRRLQIDPSVEIVDAPVIITPPAKRRRMAQGPGLAPATQQAAPVANFDSVIIVAGPSSQSASQTQPTAGRNKTTPAPQPHRSTPPSRPVAHEPHTPLAGPSQLTSKKATNITSTGNSSRPYQPVPKPTAPTAPVPGPSKPNNVPNVAPSIAWPPAIPTPAPAPAPATPAQTSRPSIATTQAKDKAPQASQPRAPRQPKPKPEKRLAIMKKKCPNAIRERLERVTIQRFFMVDRKRVDREGELREEFQVLGSTGNVYTVIIQKLPSCNCPDSLKGNHCKHILFIYAKVLQVPYESHVWYQKALLSTELEEIFAAAPLAPNDVSNPRVQQAYAQASGKAPAPAGKKRAIEEETECPICYEDMHGVQESTLTFCDTCGNALHKQCFGEWAKTKGADITCPFCRAKWPVTTANAGLRGRGANAPYGEPYLNVAVAAGLDGARDTSTYYHGPREGHRNMGYRRYGGF